MKTMQASSRAFALLIFLAVFVPSAAVADSWSDDFDDGDFTNDPAWTERNDDDVPGLVEVTGDEHYVRFFRDAPSGNGGNIELNHDVSLFVDGKSTISFDVNPVYSNVVGGAGNGSGEYPVEIRLFIVDRNLDHVQLLFCYNYRGGASLYQDDYIRVAFPDCERNVWLRDETFRIRDYFPQAVLVERIELAARGWDFEGCVDNVALHDVVLRRTEVPFFEQGLFIEITQPSQGETYHECAPDTVVWESNIPAWQGSPDVLDLYWRECGGSWQWFASDNNDGAHPWPSAPCDAGCYEVKVQYSLEPDVLDIVEFDVDGEDPPPPPPPGDPGYMIYVDFDGDAQSTYNVESRIDPPPFITVTAYIGISRYDSGPDGLDIVSFRLSNAVSDCPGIMATQSFTNLLPGNLAIGNAFDATGVTIASTQCMPVTDTGVLYIGYASYFYLGGSCDVLILDHAQYPRWVVDCQEPGRVHPYCVWTHGGIAKNPVSGDPGCYPNTAVEPKSWGAIKAMCR